MDLGLIYRKRDRYRDIEGKRHRDRDNDIERQREIKTGEIDIETMTER